MGQGRVQFHQPIDVAFESKSPLARLKVVVGGFDCLNCSIPLDSDGQRQRGSSGGSQGKEMAQSARPPVPNCSQAAPQPENRD